MRPSVSQSQNPESRMNLKDPLLIELSLVHSRLLHHRLIPVVPKQSSAVKKLQFTVLHEPVQNGQRAGMDAVNTFQYSQLTSQSRLHLQQMMCY